MSRECSCIKCHKVFSIYGIHTHYICAHEGRATYRPKDREFNVRRFKEMGKNRDFELYGDRKDFLVKCHSCGHTFIVNEREKIHPQREKYYCSRSCANRRQHSEETKYKIKDSLIKRSLELRDETQFIRLCKICEKPFNIKAPSDEKKTCSPQCRINLSKITERKKILDTSKMGGLRDGGGYSKMIDYTNSFGNTMKLNREEITLAKALDATGMYWDRNTKGFYYEDLQSLPRKYHPDFYVTDVDVYVEYKGWVTESMTHKMEDAVRRNGFKLLIIYGQNKRYKDLGLNITTVTENVDHLINALKNK